MNIELFVTDMAVKIRERIQTEPPQIVELRSEIILRDIMIELHAKEIINTEQLELGNNRIKKLYNHE